MVLIITSITLVTISYIQYVFAYRVVREAKTDILFRNSDIGLNLSGENRGVYYFRNKKSFDKNKIKIAHIGDSFTYGDEVKRDETITHYFNELQDKYQMINFGASWTGITQSYYIYRNHAKSYKPDILLIGPGAVFSERELNFNHTFDLDTSYFHSRYILVEDKLQKVSLSEDEVDQYYDFIPLIKSLKYEREKPFSIRKTVLRIFPWEKMYYTEVNNHMEYEEIYRRVLEKFTKEKTNILYFNSVEYLQRSVKNLHNNLIKPIDDIDFEKNYVRRFPFWLRFHSSGILNFHLAKKVISRLEEIPPPKNYELQVKNLNIPLNLKSISIDDLKLRLRVKERDVIIAELINPRSVEKPRKITNVVIDICDSRELLDSPVYFNTLDTESLRIMINQLDDCDMNRKFYSDDYSLIKSNNRTKGDGFFWAPQTFNHMLLTDSSEMELFIEFKNGDNVKLLKIGDVTKVFR